MQTFQVFILLMAVAFVLVGVAQKLKVPYPLLLVVGGGLLGFLPGLTVVSLDPNLILLIVLPPLLHLGAFWLSYHELKRYLNDIVSLALGLVALTTVVVACAFKWLFPELPWALAFAFGALVAPSDAVSATSVLKRFHISPKLVAILEGESLINDAFALVFYKLALVSLLTGVFSFADIGVEFIKISVGGIIVGAAVAYMIQLFLMRMSHTIVQVMFSFILPYLVYITASELQVSGVLAVVTGGLISSAFFVKRYDPLRRVLGVSTWSLLVIVLNCFVFILIGLQLKEISERVSDSVRVELIGYGLLIFAIMVFVRFIWVSGKYAVCFVRSCETCADSAIKEATIVSWCGMRGIISLACALALPLDAPGRDVAIFLTFAVIFFSLVIPGLTLAPVLSWLKVDHRPDQDFIKHIRDTLLEVARSGIGELKHLSEEDREFLTTYLNARHETRKIHLSSEIDPQPLEEARRTVLKMQREHLVKLWEEGQIDERLLKHLELELDFEEHFSIRPDAILA